MREKIKIKKDFIEIKDIMKIYGFSRRTIMNIIKENDIRLITGGKGTKYRINKEDWEKFMEGQIKWQRKLNEQKKF